jgi:catechol 2,3-dioxygenase-like lactoylglutathione lyase family enzyme
MNPSTKINPFLALLFHLFLVSSCLASPSALAQLYSADKGRVIYGHHHINTQNLDAHKRFWLEGLGGETRELGETGREVIAFSDVLVFLTEASPTSGTRGTIVNHVGFETTDIYADVARLQALGYAMITREELPETYEVIDGIGQRVAGNTIAYVLGPDDIKVELIENKEIAYNIQMHHIHWASEAGEEMRAWYAEHLGAISGLRIGQPAGQLPNVNLTFGPSETRLARTQGTVLDHIGFEVNDLKALCEELEAKGIVFDRPYAEIPALGLAIAFFTDPWGTYVELTEGLDSI